MKTITFTIEDNKICNIQDNYFHSLCQEGNLESNIEFFKIIKKHGLGKEMLFGYPELLLRIIEGDLGKF